MENVVTKNMKKDFKNESLYHDEKLNPVRRA